MVLLLKISILLRIYKQKFNNKGFFICMKKDNVYDKICFGRSFDFEYFIESIKNKKDYL